MVLLAKHAVATRARAPSAEPDALPRALRAVPRWVFALLRGPLLSANTPLSKHRVSADARVALLALYAALPPPCLLTAVYPRLYPYKSAQERPAAPLPLSWAAIRQSGCRLFLLDAYLTLFVYLAASPPAPPAPPAPPGAPPPPPAAEPSAIEFPPSKQSVLWRHVGKIKAAQLQTPRVRPPLPLADPAAACDPQFACAGAGGGMSCGHGRRRGIRGAPDRGPARGRRHDARGAGRVHFRAVHRLEPAGDSGSNQGAPGQRAG